MNQNEVEPAEARLLAGDLGDLERPAQLLERALRPVMTWPSAVTIVCDRVAGLRERGAGQPGAAAAARTRPRRRGRRRAGRSRASLPKLVASRCRDVGVASSVEPRARRAGPSNAHRSARAAARHRRRCPRSVSISLPSIARMRSPGRKPGLGGGRAGREPRRPTGGVRRLADSWRTSDHEGEDREQEVGDRSGQRRSGSAATAAWPGRSRRARRPAATAIRRSASLAGFMSPANWT